MGKGDVLASGGKKATFFPAVNRAIPLENVAEPQVILTDEVPVIVDNSALFVRPKIEPMDLEPLADMVLVKRVDVPEDSAIIQPDISKGKSDRGIVVAAGPGKRDNLTGTLIPISIRKGDLVLYDRFATVGQEISMVDEDGSRTEMLLLREYDILGRLHLRPKAE